MNEGEYDLKNNSHILSLIFVPFLLLWQKFGYFFFAKRVNCFAIFYCSALYRNNATSSQGFSFAVPFSAKLKRRRCLLDFFV